MVKFNIKSNDSSITKEELAEAIAIQKKIIPKIQQSLIDLKGKHPKLYKNAQIDLERAKSHLKLLEERLRDFDIIEKQLEEENEPEQKDIFTEFDVKQISNTSEINAKINLNIRLTHLQCEVLIEIAKNKSIHAQQIATEQKRIRRYLGLSPWSSMDDYALWQPLVQERLVKIKNENPTSSQMAFFSKSRTGEYRSKSKGMSGYEPTSYSIATYELTEKGLNIAKIIVEISQKK